MLAFAAELAARARLLADCAIEQTSPPNDRPIDYRRNVSEFDFQSDASEPPEPPPGIGDAAWAHNRWPAVGLCAGAGLGLILGGMVLLAGWWTIAYLIGGALLGCYGGLLAATMMYRQLLKPGGEAGSSRGALVGVFAGAGIGIVLGVTLNSGWLLTALYAAGCAAVAGVASYAAARLIARIS